MEYASQCLYLVLMVSASAHSHRVAHRDSLSLIQAVTQLQEQTLVFGVKLIAVVVSLFVLGGLDVGEILRFASEIFERFYLL